MAVDKGGKNNGWYNLQQKWCWHRMSCVKQNLKSTRGQVRFITCWWLGIDSRFSSLFFFNLAWWRENKYMWICSTKVVESLAGKFNISPLVAQDRDPGGINAHRAIMMSRVCRPKQISRPWMSKTIPQYPVGCNYSTTPQTFACVTNVFIVPLGLQYFIIIILW